MVKASGGIRDYDQCMKMIEAGADRIGASASVKIMEVYNSEHQN
jgi:deoxyribose-phosphate aldolase